jgi:RNA polymerase sigma-70 factor (ECF subfamily)
MLVQIPWSNIDRRLDPYAKTVRRSQLDINSHQRTDVREAALENLYEQYYEKVVRYVFIRIGNQAEAEDLAGDVFLSALKSLRSYRGSIEQMRFWIFKIARNTVVDHYRKMSKRKTVNLDDVEISDNTDVEEMTEKRLQIEALSRALDKLTPAQREVIGLRFFAGLSSAEAGQVMGKSSGAVREMQCDAIQKLRTLM